jgi:lactate/malate dehydrogenase, NAD binding domain
MATNFGCGIWSNVAAARPRSTALKRTAAGSLATGGPGILKDLFGVVAACAVATIMGGCASELVLVNRGRHRANGMATDLGYGAPLSSTTKVTDGDYSDLSDAALVMITVGVNEKSGVATDRSDPLGRLRLLEKNAEVSPGHSAD